MNYVLDTPKIDDCLTLKELCEELSISIATGRNWIKLGKLIPEYTQNRIYYFSSQYVTNIKEELQSGKNKALKNRRNKKFISGNVLYNSYVSEQCKNISLIKKLLELVSINEIDLTDLIIQILVADCALRLFVDKTKLHLTENKHFLLQFLNHEFSIGEYDQFIYDFIDDPNKTIDFCTKYPSFFCLEYVYEPKEDILGLLYLSSKNMGNRKAAGLYYTPVKTVKDLIRKFKFKSGERILDPCCGTGNFLLQLPDDVAFDDIYGNDIDPVSVKIARLNMALKFGVSAKVIFEHITRGNYLTEYSNGYFHYVLGNPPWGYEFSADEDRVLRNVFQSVSGKNIESYDVFIEQALTHLVHNGHLAFVLPEAILNVKAHVDIREIILQSCSIKNLDFIGNVFDGVQCPCIILDLQYTDSLLSTSGMIVSTGSETYTIRTERPIISECFSFNATDEEYRILKKIKNMDDMAFLLDNADFALGIVTGNNKEYISDVKTSSNEVLLKGSDIRKYHIHPSNHYIIFRPENFQQVAPTKLYRAPEKLLYRFISNQLVFAYDDKQTLSLNSCNIVIPRIQGMKMKYVMAILNSRIAQFIYKKEFNSVKVLRSHIERIPIPIVDAVVQDEIIEITDSLIAGLDIKEAECIYDEIDKKIMNIFHLTDSEMDIIRKAVDGENKFLV